MALELFKPFIYNKLRSCGTSPHQEREEMVEKGRPKLESSRK